MTIEIPRAETLDDIRRDFERVAPDLVRRASVYASSILADVAGRRGALHGRIAAVSPDLRMAGPAFTVEVRPGDNLMIHAALAMARPGDVLVVDGKGDQTCALMGAIMLTTCQKLELGGVVVDGAIRDVADLRAMGFPVYAVGSNPNGPTKACPGRINWPISCGGVTVRAGDLVVGDADGVVAVEAEKVASLLNAAEQKVADEHRRIENIRAGTDLRPSWLAGALRAAGVLTDGETL